MLAPMKNFFDEFYSFLVRPRLAAGRSVEEQASGARLLGSSAYVVYISVVLGIATWFFASYPEPLYYGTSAAALRQEVPSILTDNPLDYLYDRIFSTIVVGFVYAYCFWGSAGYFMLKKMSTPRQGALREYLSLYAFSLTPILLVVPVMVFRIFFFERWIPLRPLYPFIDFTAPNMVHLIIVGGCWVWKFVIEVRLNQAFFSIGAGKAVIPALGQASILIILLTIPAAFNDLIFEFLMNGLT
jgi:hypothetical protein